MPEGLAFGVLDGFRGVEVRSSLVRFASLPCNICNVAVVTFGVSIAVVGVPEAYRRAELAVRGRGRERCRLRGDAYVAGLGLDLAVLLSTSVVLTRAYPRRALQQEHYSTRTVHATSEYSQQGWCGLC